MERISLSSNAEHRPSWHCLVSLNVLDLVDEVFWKNSEFGSGFERYYYFQNWSLNFRAPFHLLYLRERYLARPLLRLVRMRLLGLRRR